MKSRDNSQLFGEYKAPKDLKDCEPIVNVSALWPEQQFDMNRIETTKKSKAKLDANAPAIPCGLVAKSFFNDTFKLYGSGGKQITIDEDKIAWSSDVEFKFKNI